MAKNKTSGIIAIDNGGKSTCVKTKFLPKGISFPSNNGIGEGDESLAKLEFDYVVEYEGSTYFGGTLATDEFLEQSQMFSRSKTDNFFILNALIAIHQFGYDMNYVSISVPIAMNTDDEKGKIRDRLKKEHTLKVNGEEKTFTVAEIEIISETSAAFFIHEEEGENFFLDLGSRTTGYSATLNNKEVTRLLKGRSGTYFVGVETSDNFNPKAYAQTICGKLLAKWPSETEIQLLGGGALDTAIVSAIQQYYPNAKVIQNVNPMMANVIGMYNYSKELFEGLE